MKTTVLTSFVLAYLLLATGAQSAVTAADLKARHLEVVPCRTHDADQEEADRKLVLKALNIMQKHDLHAVEKMMPDLRAAFNHAPDVPSAPELCGDSIIHYSDDMTSFLVLSGAISSGAIPGAASATQRQELPYGLLGFVVGWVEFEHKDYAAALTDYAKGLKNEPRLHSLVSEYVLTLSMMGRSEDALKAIDAFLADNPGLDDHDRANMLRKRGYALVELKRWDEAEAAYRESLKIQPGNKIAEGELDYIKSQRGNP